MVIGKDVVIGDGCVIVDSTIMEGTIIGQNSVIRESIVGWHNHIADRVSLEKTYTGDDVTVKSQV